MLLNDLVVGEVRVLLEETGEHSLWVRERKDWRRGERRRGMLVCEDAIFEAGRCGGGCQLLVLMERVVLDCLGGFS